MKIMVLLLLLVVSTAGFSEVNWTDGSYRGAGIGVENVYPQWDNHWITFQGSDGERYFYYWGVSDDLNDRARVFQDMLLTALSGGFKVSVASGVADKKGWHEFRFLSLHK